MNIFRFRIPRFQPGLALFTAAVFVSACESAPAAPPDTTASAGCTSFAAPSGSASAIASRCSDRADDSDILGREAAIAYHHAAAAYNDLGDHAAAARMSNRSFEELATNDSWLSVPPSGLSEAELRAWASPRRAFQISRVMQAGEAYRGLADGFGSSNAAGASGLCSSRTDCLSRAISRLSAGESIAAGYAGTATTPRGPEYDAYYLQLAQLHEARASAADTEPAITAYQKVAASPLSGTARSMARENLSAMATRLGQQAVAKEDAASSGLAIRYFNIAREARPQNTDAMLGLGSVYLDLGSAAGDIDQLRTAEQAYTDALQAASSDAERAAAYSGRGATRDALAGLLGTSRQSAIEDYEAAANYASSADAFLVLARACTSREDWACADGNYTKGIARLKGEGASGAAISSALIEQAGVRARMPQYGPAEVRGLLQEATSAAPASADAVIALARHDMRHGNWSSAETGLKRITGSGLQNADTYKAEAWSQLSRLAATRPGASLAQAVSYADEAVKLDSANPLYLRQACLARIYRGGSSVTDTDNRASCSMGTQVEAQMLRAMFEMRRAQYYNANVARQIRRTALDHVDNALAGVEPGAMTDFDWPDETSLPPVKTKAILLYMKEAALACGGNYSFNLPDEDGITSADYSGARSFLDFYNARLCT